MRTIRPKRPYPGWRASDTFPKLAVLPLAVCLACVAPLLLAAARAGAPEPAAYPDPPEVLFGDLFVAVQTAGIYADSKTFADAVPRASPQTILSEYHAAQSLSPQALKRFVDQRFEMPADSVTAAELVPAAAVSQSAALVAHIDRLWDVLTRSALSAPPHSSLLRLPEPYVIPGGRFREIYYWDSYFTMLGLDQSGRHDLVEHMVRDFAWLIDTY
jgi:alpha,alpha-trehalase